ncbi:MAG TPA: biotin/lipoyl-containing protein [Thermoanaerobaculia bacterium]|nr:biotin/lipoyl-containing protein [Thermoanaerobaculia bacterium]
MELIVTVGERQERVRVERDGAGWTVRVGAAAYRVDQQALGPHHRSLLVAGEQHEVVVLPRGEGRYWVSSRRGGALVAVTDVLSHLAAVAAGGAARRSQRVTAYMPGRVVAVLAAEGEEVAAGQGIVVLEAMKMENEIRTEHAGVLRKIAVTEGQAVEGGDLLFELE